MKNFIALFALLFANLAMGDIGPVGRSTALKYDGTVESGSEEKIYINVLNKSGATQTAGALVVWDASNDDGASVTTSITANALPACVVVGSANGQSTSCSANALCKCQTYGLAEVKFGVFAGSAAAGGPVYISRDRLGYVEATPYASITISMTQIGMFYDAEAATNDAAQVFLKLR